MRVFAAGLGTETNTFSPLPTGLSEFKKLSYYPGGTHPETMTTYGGPLFAARTMKARAGWQLHEGLVAGAQPGGLTTRNAYETLRDEILADLSKALPVDIVVLGLHGAMVADGYDDCEGDLLRRVRELVGTKTIIGAEFDPHAHLTQTMVDNATVLVGYKEYPHTDIKDRAFQLIALCDAVARKESLPIAALVDTGMVVPIHTSRDPGRAFVDRLMAMEGKDKILSISPIQGFATGDVPEMGCRVLVYLDGAQGATAAQAEQLARSLADELIAMRDALMVDYLSIDDAIDSALAEEAHAANAANAINGPVVLADRADNPGSGAAGDSTFLLQRLIEREVTGAALGPLWDPSAVQIAFSAGEGARLPMRIGGKTSAMSGSPVDADCHVLRLEKNYQTTTLAGDRVSVGDTALVEVGGIKCVLISNRSQAINIDLFTGLGVDLTLQRLVVVKSAQHFQASFSRVAGRIIYVKAPGSATPDWRTLAYKKARMPKWPIS